MASLRALDPILFLLYTADVLVIAGQYGVSAHSYADDTLLYIHYSTDSCSMLFRHLTTCINEIGSWMSSKRLKLNSEKTQFTCLGSRYQLAKVDTTAFIFNNSHINILSVVTCLGVEIDQKLAFSDHIRCISRRCFYWLRQFRSVRRTLTNDTTIALVNASVISRVDYCNAELTGAYDIHLRQLQGVLNAAANLVVRKRKFDGISDTLRDVLHWLPIRQRTAYKLSVLMFNCLHSVAPGYLITMCQPVSENPGRRYLRSAVRRDLVVPATRTVRFGPRSFAAAGPSTWNTLPVGLRNQQLSAVSFRHHL